ncbi:MAG: nucleotidyltransferase family protein [Proteiniphilum sp.]|nr:nucleotidyltransferase family protein [Proteiniphilum sp.]MDD3969106.1 nucleotidyltransferase family protein [Proteiniphilum sp.]
MKAMIFAAGLGTRLKPLTDTMPKALVPVGGKPLLQHIIEKLKSAGFDEIIINLHHFPDQIIDFVETHHHFDIRIEFSDEREQLLDTGGGIKKASWFFEDHKPFLIHNVDILSDIDLQKLYEAHTQSCPTATLVCSKRKTSRYLLFDSDNRLKGWTNEKTGEVKSPFPDIHPDHYNKLAFSGIQMLQPSILRYMQHFPDKFSIIDFYLSVCAKERVAGYMPVNLKMIDVGKPGSPEKAARLFL